MTITDEIDIEGGPNLQLKKVPVLKCDHCQDILMDGFTVSETRQRALAALIYHFSNKLEINGKTADWMRKAASLTIKQLTTRARTQIDTFRTSVLNNTLVDRFTTYTLLCLASDSLTGCDRGANLLRLTRIFDPAVDNKMLHQYKCDVVITLPMQAAADGLEASV